MGVGQDWHPGEVSGNVCLLRKCKDGGVSQQGLRMMERQGLPKMQRRRGASGSRLLSEAPQEKEDTHVPVTLDANEKGQLCRDK